VESARPFGLKNQAFLKFQEMESEERSGAPGVVGKIFDAFL
jgi:hypothetical protein